MLHMHLLKCFDKYHETSESRESVDQKWDRDDSASPRVTPRAPTPFGRASEGSMCCSRTARAIHLASPVINKKVEGNYIPPMPGLKRGEN